MRRESSYQSDLIKTIKARFPGIFVMKMPTDTIQGIPDLLLLYGDRWAILEAKRSEHEPFQPNQEYYIDMFDEMSFASVIHPNNEEEVLNELRLAFRVGRPACVSQS